MSLMKYKKTKTYIKRQHLRTKIYQRTNINNSINNTRQIF